MDDVIVPAHGVITTLFCVTQMAASHVSFCQSLFVDVTVQSLFGFALKKQFIFLVRKRSQFEDNIVYNDEICGLIFFLYFTINIPLF